MTDFVRDIVGFIREYHKTNEFIPLHAPKFIGNEKHYVCETLESTFVSSVGMFVTRFEDELKMFTKAPAVSATVNGSSALYISLYMAGVRQSDLVITQPMTFVATCNAISQLGASPIFVDIDDESLGLSPLALEAYLSDSAYLDDAGVCRDKSTNRVIKAVLPMHTFGHPVKLKELITVCEKWHLLLIEDAAESLGSLYKGQHTGTFGFLSALSFNGNKTITTGGGGAVIASSELLGEKVKHLTSTAKVPHDYEYYHDELGFNFRMPNINAALGCGQLEYLDKIILEKRNLARLYQEFFKSSELSFVSEPDYATSNYWLNAVIAPSPEARDVYINALSDKGIMTRPVWRLMNTLPMFSNCLKGDLARAEYFQKRIINIPSTPNLVIK
ncbi:LegC family aminotransferase [Pseudoalteromonas piscicida]|uniref:LegC family aminotransferase n=1 Tax=Pseudoalteromonas TaxID=53246 RepID=UPI001572B47B|nr:MULTISPECIES: LegC family aminotransferase [Pseudoalteromonas]MCG7552481.1 LegC family aminotransferase [Pseudoalteromonas sp. Of11M-6]NSY32136.1 LegC family aminotransferase [Pseudoalteromonas sp. JC28]UDM62207.1 LegC family aminotransferase [Pseudoalteromonas piscicida]